mgnify:FL=1
MKCKNTIAMVLAGAMLLPSNAFAADLSQYKDFPNDWSAKSLEQAIDDGLLNGSNGMIDAKGLLTRAQMAAIVSRAFGAAKTASLDDYRDVLPSAWYYSDMGKAVKMGAYMGAKLDGNVTFHVADGVKLNQFLGEQSGGSITGNLTLQINGTPTLKSYNPTYKASVNRDSFGTLDLTCADVDFITANRDKFTGFATTVMPTT